MDAAILATYPRANDQFRSSTDEPSVRVVVGCSRLTAKVGVVQVFADEAIEGTARAMHTSL